MELVSYYYLILDEELDHYGEELPLAISSLSLWVSLLWVFLLPVITTIVLDTKVHNQYNCTI